MPVDVPFLRQRYEKLKAHQDGFWISQWQSLADYILPRKNMIQRTQTRGGKRTERQFDSTAQEAAEMLGSNLHGNLTSDANKWFSLKIRQDELNEEDEVQDWLDECAKRMYKAKRQSNFSPEIQEAYLDLVVFGTSATLQEEMPGNDPGFRGLLYKTMALGSYVIDEDATGRVDTLMRGFEMSARAAVHRWGLAKVGKMIREAYDAKDMDKLFPFIHAVYPREDARPKRNPRARDLPYASCYIAKDENHLVHESGFHDFPFMVARWSKDPGEIYGRGRGEVALPTTKTLNKFVEMKLQALAMAVRPPILVRDDGVIGTIRLTPGGPTMVRDLESLKAFESGSRFDVAAVEEEKLQAIVKNIFFVNELMLPPTRATGDLTATEVTLRWEIMQRLLGPTLGRLESELLNRDVQLTFGMMLRARPSALPPIPSVLLEREADLDIEYEGPLARAQRMGEVDALDRLYTFIAQTAELFPGLKDNFDHDKAVRLRAEVLGIPASIVLAHTQVAAIRQAQQEEIDAAQEQEEAVAISEMARNAAPAIKALTEGSRQQEAVA